MDLPGNLGYVKVYMFLKKHVDTLTTLWLVGCFVCFQNAIGWIFSKLVISQLLKKNENVLGECKYSILPKVIVICEQKVNINLEITSVCSTLDLCNNIIPYSIILLSMEWFPLNKL